MSELEKRADSSASEPAGAKASRGKAKPTKKKDKKPNPVARWFKDLRGELKKVTWPTGKDTMRNVGTVVLWVLLVGVFIGGLDFIARQVVDALLNLFG